MKYLINPLRKRNVSFSNKIINTLFWPALLMMALVCIVAISSALIVGNIAGENALSAVNLVFPFYAFANFFGGMIGIGTSFLYFRHLGEREKDKANEIFTQGLILAVAIGIILFLAMQFGEKLYLKNLNISEEIMAEIRAYWKFYKFLIASVPLNYFLLQMLYTDTVINIAANLSFFVLGIGLSILFTKLYGTMGASLGMLVGTTISTLILSLHFLSKKNIISLKWHFSFKDIGKMCRLSLVDSSKYLDSGLLLTFINYFVINHFSESMLPITSVVLTVFDIIVIFDTIGASYSPLSEVYLGEGNNYDQKKCAEHSFVLAIIFGIVFMAVMLIIAPYIPSLYGISSKENIEFSAKCIRIFALSMPFAAMNYMLISQYVIVRKIALAVSYEWVKNFIAPLVLILIFGNIFGYEGLWISFIIAEIITLIGFIIGIRLFVHRKQSIFLVKECDFPLFSKSYIASKENAILARDEVQDFLLKNKISEKIIYKIMLIIEESSMMVAEKNSKKKLIIQFTLQIHDDEVLIFERDNGIHFELSDTDAKITDFRQYFYNSLLDSYFHKQYFLTIDYNRNIFSIKR